MKSSKPIRLKGRGVEMPSAEARLDSRGGRRVMELAPVRVLMDPPPALHRPVGDGDGSRIGVRARFSIAMPSPQDNSRAVSVWVEEFGKVFGLSVRERQLVLLVAVGTEGKRLPDEMRCSAYTVATYWSRVFAKTWCRSQKDVLALLIRFIADTAFARVED